jgi:hypothetical protein
MSPVARPDSRAQPWFVSGDYEGFFGLAIDNLIQFLLIIGLCQMLERYATLPERWEDSGNGVLRSASPARDERAAALMTVATQGYIADYRGARMEGVRTPNSLPSSSPKQVGQSQEMLAGSSMPAAISSKRPEALAQLCAMQAWLW